MYREELEEAFEAQEPSCLSCGWMNAFYELGWWDFTGVVLEDGRKEYHTQCRSKDADDPSTHRGYFIYLRKEE